MLPEPINADRDLEYSLTNSGNELELVQMAQNGDTDVFKQLFDTNVRRIYAFCLRMAMNRETAEEITQDVFVKAWEKLHTFRGESKFTSWLHSIAVNEFLMRKRSEKRFLQKFMTTDNIYQFDKHADGSESHYHTNIDLEKAISVLPEQAKAVFVLHDIEGYQHKEIADMMNIEIGTTKAHLHRARKLLREELTK
jgi:RNA polymerase sigma-70 factor (ECF subfamily)